MAQSTICLIVFVFTIVMFIINKFPLWLTALTGMLLMCVTGCITAEEALSGFANPTAITMVSMFVVAAGLSRTQMIHKISNLAYKVSGGSFTKGLAGYVLVTFVIAQVVPSAVLIYTISYPLCADFCRKMGVSPSKAMFSIGLTAVSAVLLTPVGAGAVTYIQMNGLMEAYGATGFEVGMFDMMIARLPMTIAVMVYGIFLAPKLSVDRGPVDLEGQPGGGGGQRPPLDPVREVIGYSVFLLVVLGLLFSSYLPVESWQVCMIGALVISFSGVLNEKETVAAMNLPPMLLYVGALGIGAGLINTGAGDMVSGLVLGILGESPSPIFVGAVFFLISFVFTQVMSNMALYNALVPVAVLTCVSLGYNPIGVLALVYIGCFTAYLTPMATIAVPLIMSTGGYTQGDLLKLGWLPALLTGVISVPWCMLMFPA